MASSSCLARTGGQVATSCIGAPASASLSLLMDVRFSDGHVEPLGVPSSRVTWSDTSNCTDVSPTGTSGVFTLRILGECESTLVVATVDGKVNSTVSVCIESMVGVHISASFYPNGQTVPTGGDVPRIPCSSEYHRVQATAACSTSVATRPALSSAVTWQIGLPATVTTQQATVIITLPTAVVPVNASIGDRHSVLSLVQSSSESTISVVWSPPATLSLQHGSQVTYPPVVTFDNSVSATLDGSFSWLSASDLIS
eukprot:4958456-Prymnesium_polylepis.1